MYSLACQTIKKCQCKLGWYTVLNCNSCMLVTLLNLGRYNSNSTDKTNIKTTRNYKYRSRRMALEYRTGAHTWVWVYSRPKHQTRAILDRRPCLVPTCSHSSLVLIKQSPTRGDIPNAMEWFTSGIHRNQCASSDTQGAISHPLTEEKKHVQWCEKHSLVWLETL